MTQIAMQTQRQLERDETAHAALTAARRLLVLGRDREAADAFVAAGTLAGVDQAALYEGLAQAVRNQGKIEPALQLLDFGLQRFPGHASLRFLRSLLLLGNGQFREGWPEYEMRLKTPMRCYLPRAVTWPRLVTTELLGNKKILIWSEQGFGDEIMFASLIQPLSGFCNLTFECSRDTAPLFRRSFPGVRVFPVELSGAMPEALHGESFDYECPLGSLPLALQLPGIYQHQAETYLKTDPQLTADIRALLKATAQGRRIVGVSWRGGTGATRQVARSLSLPQLDPILNVPGILFVALQHDMTLAELQTIPHELLSWPHLVKQVDSLAALIGACDEIVTVCGTNVHLAGAMGKPVTVLAPHVPEWRYLFKGENMPWYRNVKVHRQPEYGKWEPVIAQVADNLRSEIPCE